MIDMNAVMTLISLCAAVLCGAGIGESPEYRRWRSQHKARRAFNRTDRGSLLRPAKGENP